MSSGEDCDDIPPIMTVPREVRAVIYNKLSEKQLLELRLVCQQWRKEIDDLCDFTVEIDERKPSFERILELRVKKCTVVHFVRPPPLGTSNTYLNYPNLLRSLHILTDKIASDNFFYLIGDCAQYLTEFSALLSTTLISSIFPFTLSNVRFDKLKKLNLILNTVSTELGPFRPPMGPIKTEDILFSQILSNPMENLKTLRIEIRCVGMVQISRFSSLVFSFIGKHWKNLVSLDFDLIQGHGMPLSEAKPLKDSDLNEIDFALLKKVKNLNSVRVLNSTSIGIDIWTHLLAQQEKLEYFETDILPVPNSLFKSVISKNYQTLVQVDISDMSVWGEEDVDQFDVTVFENCSSLKKLTLDRNAVQRRLYECPEIINMFNLPDSLEELALNYFLILSDELLLLFSGNLSENLKSISLTQCGNSGMFGVDGTVLERIICLPSINFIEISALNYSDAGERVKLNLILNNFGYGDDRSYFQLSKIGSELQADLID